MPPGSLAIGPAGVDFRADVEGSFDSLLVAIDPARLALAAAEDSAYEARLVDRLLIRDAGLVELAEALATESMRGYPNGPLFWSEASSRFIDALLVRHTAEPPGPTRGRLSSDMLDSLKAFVVGHLDEPIAVDMLAQLAGRSTFHFSRIFARSVGVTPHRFIVHLRLKRAVALAREGRLSFAEIAVRTGFADQSHLSRWVRRVYGASLRQLAA